MRNADLNKLLAVLLMELIKEDADEKPKKEIPDFKTGDFVKLTGDGQAIIYLVDKQTLLPKVRHDFIHEGFFLDNINFVGKHGAKMRFMVKDSNVKHIYQCPFCEFDHHADLLIEDVYTSVEYYTESKVLDLLSKEDTERLVKTL